MITVVIPFYKNKTQYDKCVAALKNVKIITHDDSDKGEGFTKSVNYGIKAAIKTEPNPYYLILNQDCYLEKDAISNMVEFMEAHPKCAIAGIKQLSSEDKDHIIHGGTGECFPAGKHVGGLVSHGDCAENKQVPWVNGACMIVRAEALLSIGLMDENYKMFGSDADWSYTARARNWETWYIADATCTHEQGASKVQDEKTGKVFDYDMLYFRDKWINGEQYRDLSLEIF